MTTIVRHAQLHRDIAAIIQIESVVWPESPSNSYDLATLIASRNVLVAEHNDAVVAYLAIVPTMGDEIWIDAVAVLPACRRLGIGRLLYARALRSAARCSAFINTINESSKAFHAALGFGYVGTNAVIDGETMEIWTRRRP